MIPSDVASSLRQILPDQQAGSNLQTQPVASAQRIIDVLSNLVPGQRILAEIQALLPNGNFRAVVAQRDVTLALPFAAKAGDTLELEVTESDGKLTLAFVTNKSDTTTSKLTAESVTTSLSTAGKVIGTLLNELDGEGKRAPPAPLNGNQALIDEMPKSASDLAPILKQALTQSGMFYEAHQARWVAGNLPAEALKQEPQAKHASGRNTAVDQPNGTKTSTFPQSTLVINGSIPSVHTQNEVPSLTPRPQQTAALLLPESLKQEPQAKNAAILTTSVEPPEDNKPQNTFTLDNNSQSNRPSVQIQALSQSIMFYEAQQPPVTAAELPVDNLKQEPPAKYAPVQNDAADLPKSTETISFSKSALSADSSIANTRPEAQMASSSSPQFNVTSQSTSSQTTTPIPAELRPLVQQQLDGLATQNFAWQGQIWPGQQMWWEISENTDDGAVNQSESAQWQTRLKLSLPSLGGIDLTLRLRASGEIGIAATAASELSERRLREATGILREQFAAAGLTLSQLLVKHDQQADA